MATSPMESARSKGFVSRGRRSLGPWVALPRGWLQSCWYVRRAAGLGAGCPAHWRCPIAAPPRRARMTYCREPRRFLFSGPLQYELPSWPCHCSSRVPHDLGPAAWPCTREAGDQGVHQRVLHSLPLRAPLSSALRRPNAVLDLAGYRLPVSLLADEQVLNRCLKGF